ncbi:hypothetical protein J7F03_01435 [Streptomyces sp. ISL-43]|uniref:hypothetical protein n=1 Tax=Streptomyces sp. ISL-43 TaxID=2819183 RepID=UPI001BEC3A25|nr:hypothetical protein [Streptomyces sp. ISL-43]MBT2445770.1 hypothetical protein [Streptomyces sp. ISL-43]
MESRTVSCGTLPLGLELGLGLGLPLGEDGRVPVGDGVSDPSPLAGALEAVGLASAGSPASRSTNHTAAAPIASATTATPAVLGVSHRPTAPPDRGGADGTGYPGGTGCGCGWGAWPGAGGTGPYPGAPAGGAGTPPGAEAGSEPWPWPRP